MSDKKRVFIIVLDSFGVGELPDAYLFGDEGSNTALSVSKSEYFVCPNIVNAGLFAIPTLYGKGKVPEKFTSAFGYSAEKSKGKDTIAGHWEISGVITEKPFPTYPDGFPEKIISDLEEIFNIKTLCHKPYSGTEVIKDYGEEHLKTKYPIVYTSADSVLQIACHDSLYSLNELYDLCIKARKYMQGENAVARVIARPFSGNVGGFYRTSGRHDYALHPTGETICDIISESEKDVISVGKIRDIFTGRGITESNPTSGNTEGIEKIKEFINRDFDGLCFVNLVDFDAKYGHRNDVSGYAKAMTEFDVCLGEILPKLRENDLLIVTADHGCDPETPSTDHSREYIPIFCFGKNIKTGYFGKRETYADIGCTVCDFLGVKPLSNGTSFIKDII